MTRAPHPNWITRCGAVLAALAVISGVWLLFRRLSGPSRRMVQFERGEGVPLTVIDGEIYYRRPTGQVNALDIRARPLRGGRSRRVLQYTLDPKLESGIPGEGQVELIGISREGVLFLTREPRILPQREGRPDLGPPGRGAPPPRASGENTWLPAPRVHLWRVPLRGGRPEELLAERKAAQMLVSGDTCYWLQSELLELKEPVRRPADAVPRQVLFAEPLKGGVPRKVAVMPRGFEPLHAVGRGVYWHVRLEREKPVLIGARAPAFIPTVVEGYPSQYAGNLVEINNRLFWLDREEPRPSEPSSGNHQIVSAAPDGSDRRIILDLRVERAGRDYLSQLATDGSALYFFRHRASAGRGKAVPEERLLCRLPPHGRAAPQALLRTTSPGAVHLLGSEGSMVYCLAQETRENWFDWSPHGLEPRLVYQVYQSRVVD